MIEQVTIDPPLELTTFLDRLHANGQPFDKAQDVRVVPGSLIWVKHPEKPGWMVPAVKVETVEPIKRRD